MTDEELNTMKEKVLKNESDCEQLWAVIKAFLRPASEKAHLDKKTWTTLIASLMVGVMNLQIKVLM